MTDDEGRPASSTRSGTVASWPIRSKLVALVALPLLVIVAICAVLVTQAVTSLQDARAVHRLTDVVLLSAQASNAIAREQAQSVTAVNSGAAVQVLKQLRPGTDQALTRLTRDLADPPSGGWPGRVDASAATVRDLPRRLSTLRTGVDAGNRNADQVIGNFKPVQDAVLALSDASTTEAVTLTDDPSIAEGVGTGAALGRAAAAAGQERDLLVVALQERRLSNDSYRSMLQHAAAQAEQFSTIGLRATPDQANRLEIIRTDDTRMDAFRKDAAELAKLDGEAVKVDNSNLNDVNTTFGDPGSFASLGDQRVSAISDLGVSVADTTNRQATTSERQELLRAGGFLALALLIVLAVLVILTMIARTITGPLRRLRTNAVEMSAVRLPAAMQKISEQGGGDGVSLPSVLPAELSAGPETTEVARAVDELGAEAVRLASAQVTLRRALDEAFVSMSRRSQSMVEKQLAIIDELESAEQDPDHLRNLFRLDHLAARMRRYNDNLLVIAGSAVRTRTTSPVRIAELFRAATSEMEQYERVRLQPVGGATVLGTVAGELIHLLAELLDNAAMYSPPTSTITLSAAFTSDGGLHLEVIDSGVGIQANELERLNARLNTTSDDAEVSSRMGLFVVARLARRGGFSVRLQARTDAPGTVAQVSVPSALVLGAPGSTGEQPQLPVQAAPAPAPFVAQRPASSAPANGVADAESAPRRSPSGLPVRTPGGAALPRRPLTPAAGAPGGGLFTPAPTGEQDGDRSDPADTPAAAQSSDGERPAAAAEHEPMPTEAAARSAAAGRYIPVHDDLPMIGSYSAADAAADVASSTPIFDSISAWFADDPETREIPLREVAATAGEGAAAGEGGNATIDLRDAQQEAVTSSRWSSLDDRRWVATNARAAAGPEVSGNTESGLPRRRPGANLLPSASTAAAAPAAPAAGRASGGRAAGGRDADAVRGRLGSYQRGLATARASSGSNPFDGGTPTSGGLFTATREPEPPEDGASAAAGDHAGDHGGDHGRRDGANGSDRTPPEQVARHDADSAESTDRAERTDTADSAETADTADTADAADSSDTTDTTEPTDTAESPVARDGGSEVEIVDLRPAEGNGTGESSDLPTRTRPTRNRTNRDDQGADT